MARRVAKTSSKSLCSGSRRPRHGKGAYQAAGGLAGGSAACPVRGASGRVLGALVGGDVFLEDPAKGVQKRERPWAVGRIACRSWAGASTVGTVPRPYLQGYLPTSLPA